MYKIFWHLHIFMH